MTIEECLAEAREERNAKGIVNDKLVTVKLKKTLRTLEFPYRWKISVFAYWKTSRKYFFRRSSADSYFEELIEKYGLEEETIQSSGGTQ